MRDTFFQHESFLCSSAAVRTNRSNDFMHMSARVVDRDITALLSIVSVKISYTRHGQICVLQIYSILTHHYNRLQKTKECRILSVLIIFPVLQ